MAAKYQKLRASTGKTEVEVRNVEIVREASSPTGWAARGISRQGSLVRFPVPGASLDGVELAVPAPAVQRSLAPEATPKT